MLTIDEPPILRVPKFSVHTSGRTILISRKFYPPISFSTLYAVTRTLKKHPNHACSLFKIKILYLCLVWHPSEVKKIDLRTAQMLLKPQKCLTGWWATDTKLVNRTLKKGPNHACYLFKIKILYLCLVWHPSYVKKYIKYRVFSYNWDMFQCQ